MESVLVLYLQNIVIVPAAALTLKGQQEAHTFPSIDGPGTALQVRVQAVTPQVSRRLDESGYGDVALKHIFTTCGGVGCKPSTAPRKWGFCFTFC